MNNVNLTCKSGGLYIPENEISNIVEVFLVLILLQFFFYKKLVVPQVPMVSEVLRSTDPQFSNNPRERATNNFFVVFCIFTRFKSGKQNN